MTSAPAKDDLTFSQVLQMFKVGQKECQLIAHTLKQNMLRGLSAATHDDAPVKMYPSYVTNLPTGQEQGVFLAIDVGGTKFRVLIVQIGGAQQKFSFREFSEIIPKHLLSATSDELFDYFASTIGAFLREHDDLVLHHQTPLKLGFTFSFPCKQQGLRNAVLQTWTKNFAVSGVEGRNVAQLLQAALDRHQLNVQCVAVLNDTVGTLSSCALEHPDCAIGVIIGTGTNASYIERIENIELITQQQEKGDRVCVTQPQHMIINMEWGNFGADGCLADFQTEFDVKIDRADREGSQRFEKLISGMYVEQLMQCVLARLVQSHQLFRAANQQALLAHLASPNAFRCEMFTQMENDVTPRLENTRRILAEQLHVDNASDDDVTAVHVLSTAIIKRAAYFAGAGLACLINHTQRDSITIGVDGSLARFHPKFQTWMSEMADLLKSPQYKYKLELATDGSGKGAAAIAATND